MLTHLLSDPFRGFLECITELPSLKHILVWAQAPLSAFDLDVESGGEVENFIANLNWTEDILRDMEIYARRDFSHKVGYYTYCSLYTPTPSTALSCGRDLQCRDIPAPGLPEWGYAMFMEVSHLEPEPTDFDYHNAKLRFDHIEYDLHTSG